MTSRKTQRMQIGILSRNPSLYSTRQLVLAARRRGHEVKVLDTLRVSRALDPKRRFGYALDLRLVRQLQAVIPRIGTSISVEGVTVVQVLEKRGVFSTASAAAIENSRNKLASFQLMQKSGLPLPDTVVVTEETALSAAVAAVGGLPVVLKPLRGTQGRGIHLIHSLADLETIVNILLPNEPELLLQSFIAEADGTDTRIIVVGDACVAAMERRASAGDFRANLHLGGSAVPIQLDEATQALAVQAAHLHDLHVAGVDLIKSRDGYRVLEINSSPGLEGIEKTTEVDVAGAIITFLETRLVGRYRRQRPKRHRRSSRSRRRNH